MSRNFGYNTNQTIDNSNEQIFDEDVQRFDADSYRQKYGDRWKKLASSVRDVVQPDGTIIREYVIEDPTLLEQLSEDDENINYKDNNEIQKPVNNYNPSPNRNYMNQEKNIQMSSPNKYDFSSLNKNNQNHVNSNLEAPYQKSPSKPILNQNSGSTSKPNDESKNDSIKSNKYFQPIVPSNNGNVSPNRSINLNSNRNVEEEADKEVEIIHEQGKHLKQYEEVLRQQHTSNSQATDNTSSMVEYEILDEHGNQIMINGAEQLKKLAVSVSEIKQSDGSIVKEYILNDPKVIEQIRNQIANSNPSNHNSDSSISSISTVTNNNNNNNNNYNNNHNNNNNNNNSNNFNGRSITHQAPPTPATKPPSSDLAPPNYHQIPRNSPNESKMPITNNGTFKGQLSNKPITNIEAVRQILNNSNIPQINPSFMNQAQNFSRPLNSPKEQSTSGQLKSQQNNIASNHIASPEPIVSQQPKPKPPMNSINSQLQQQIQKQLEKQNKQPEKPNESMKQANRTQFELKTSRGKALQFTITSDDPSESDIEEIKAIIKNRLQMEDKSMKKCSESSTDKTECNIIYKELNYSSKNVKIPEPKENKESIQFQNTLKKSSTSFQPKNQSNNVQTINKSGSVGNILDSVPLTATLKTLNSNTTLIDHKKSKTNIQKREIPNNSKKMPEKKNEIGYLNYLSHAKSYANMNFSLNDDLNTADNDTEYKDEAYEDDYYLDSSHLKRSSSFENSNNYSDSTMNINLDSYNSNKINEKRNNMIKQLQKPSNHNINTATYTKSTFNLSYPYQHPVIDAQSNISSSSNSSYSGNQQQHQELRNKFTLSKQAASSSMMDDLDKIARNLEVTPEMTEQLLLKLLLQQITLQQQKNNSINPPKKSQNDANFLLNKVKLANMANSQTSINPNLHNQIKNGYSNTIKNKLVQKSMSNFCSIEDDCGYDDYINVNNDFQTNFNYDFQNNSNKYGNSYSNVLRSANRKKFY